MARVAAATCRRYNLSALIFLQHFGFESSKCKSQIHLL
jgi:hypothetical protein